jgi:hypothetical protein
MVAVGGTTMLITAQPPYLPDGGAVAYFVGKVPQGWNAADDVRFIIPFQPQFGTDGIDWDITIIRQRIGAANATVYGATGTYTQTPSGTGTQQVKGPSNTEIEIGIITTGVAVQPGDSFWFILTRVNGDANTGFVLLPVGHAIAF